MSDTPLAVTYVDMAHGVHTTARADFALVFADGSASSYDEQLTVETTADGWSARLPGGIELELKPVAQPVELGGMRAHLCSAGDGIGVVAEIHDPPRWHELDATRYVTALFDPQNALLAFARRPAGSLGHGDELVIAHLWTDGDLKGVEDARLSTIYDGEGRPRQASMELWLPGEDFPRRAFGAVTAGGALGLGGVGGAAGGKGMGGGKPARAGGGGGAL